MNENASDPDDLSTLSDVSTESVEQPSGSDAISLQTRPRIWTAFAVPICGLLFAVSLQAAIGAIAGVVMAARGVQHSQIPQEFMKWLATAAGFITLLACSEVGFALPMLFAASRSPESTLRRLGMVPLQNPVRISVLTAIGSIVPLTFSFFLVYVTLAFIPTDSSLEEFFVKLTPAWGIVFVCAVALAPGFVEEMLFRGYVQRRLLQRWSPAKSILVATILFSLAHIMPHAIALAFPLGLWFGVIAWRVGSIVPTIVCHAFVNGGLNAWRLVIKFGELSETSQLVGNFFFFAVGAICFALSCQILAKYEPPDLTQLLLDSSDPSLS